MSYTIKVKAPEMKRWEFLTPQGELTNLRVHASQFPDQATAEKAASMLRAENPDIEFVVREF